MSPIRLQSWFASSDVKLLVKRHRAHKHSLSHLSKVTGPDRQQPVTPLALEENKSRTLVSFQFRCFFLHDHPSIHILHTLGIEGRRMWFSLALSPLPYCPVLRLHTSLILSAAKKWQLSPLSTYALMASLASLLSLLQQLPLSSLPTCLWSSEIYLLSVADR